MKLSNKFIIKKFNTTLIFLLSLTIFFYQNIYSSRIEINNESQILKINKSRKLILDKVIQIRKNDTLKSVIINLGIDFKITYQIIKSISKVFDIKKLKIGEQLIIAFNNKKLKIKDCPKKIKIITNAYVIDGIFHKYKKTYNFKKTKQKPLEKLIFVKGTLKSNLYNDLIKSGANSNITSKYIRLLNKEINFKKDLERQTEFKILHNQKENISGNITDYGDIIYASLVNNKRNVALFKFNDGNNSGYHYQDGSNFKDDYFIKPIANAKITSGFGNRVHPITGKKCLHKGVDFGAKIGTPIKSVANGIVYKIHILRNGYGKHIIIKHNNLYSSLYAHLSKFAYGISKNTKVSKGDIIGFVGNTGSSTAPHLHFEVRKNNNPTNPMKIQYNIDNKLRGKKLIAFNKQKSTINKIINEKTRIMFTNKK